VAARISAPSLGAASYQAAGTWTATVSERWQRSDRHFIGDREQEQREEEGSQVINNINVVDIGIGYAITKRFNAILSIPFQFATRQQKATLNGVRQPRFETQASGLSDIKVLGTAWLLDPDHNKKQNISVGLGVKFPTGDKEAKDTFQVARGRAPNQVLTAQVRNVDQSIQPGDGGWGIIFDLYGFRELVRDLNLFLAGTYIAQPQETAGVVNGAGPTLMSVADSYLARGGFGYTFLPKYGLTVTLGGRMEGTPARDLIGESGGFRRPGFAVSIEPGLVWLKNSWSASVSAPVALYRNRETSVLDEQTGRHGDAAFADYMLLFSVGKSF
jgi:hypothetical protein